MKTIKTLCQIFIFFTIIMIFQSCAFFYGREAELSYTAMFDSLWQDYDDTYALFEVRGVDWTEQYKNCRPLIHDDMTDKDFLEVLKRLLYPLNDAHVYVKADIGCLNSGEDNVIADIFSLDAVCKKNILKILKNAEIK